MYASGFQKPRPHRVVFDALDMLAAIQLDREPKRRAVEIQDIGADHMLPAERQAFELRIPQPRP
jgi:hypothetical protein